MAVVYSAIPIRTQMVEEQQHDQGGIDIKFMLQNILITLITIDIIRGEMRIQAVIPIELINIMIIIAITAAIIIIDIRGLLLRVKIKMRISIEQNRGLILFRHIPKANQLDREEIEIFLNHYQPI